MLLLLRKTGPDMLRNTTYLTWFTVTTLLVGSMVSMSIGERALAAPSSSPTSTFPTISTPTDTYTPTETLTFSSSPAATSTSISTPSDTHTPTETLTASGSPTDTYPPTYSATATLTLSPTRTATPIPPPHPVISEFRTRGPGGSYDEFVELYNPTGAAINIGGWDIQYSSSCGLTISTLFVIASNTVLQAGGHFLAASWINSTVTGADQTFYPALPDAGGLALINLANQVVDQVGMCISTQFREGMNLIPLSGNTNQSYERKPGGNTACYDTDNNAGDFVLISPSNPQNENSPIVLCAGMVTSTPSLTPSSTPTPTLTRTNTPFPGSLVINEFLPHPHTDWNDDGVVNVGDEYIELINVGAATINIQNWELDNGSNTAYYTLPNMNLLPRQIVLFFHSETGIPLSDGGGTVRLLKPNRQTADIYNYPPVEAMDVSWCRLPDGGSWGFACRPSPGQPNIPLNSLTPSPASSGATSVETDCNLADTVPESIASAECGGFGSGIWNDATEGSLWLPERGKWDVFVE